MTSAAQSLEVSERVRVMAVAGGRDFNDMRAVYDTLDMVNAAFGPVECVMHGACPTGADAFTDRWGIERGVRVDRYPADWARFGNSAGPRRNSAMIARRPDALVTFQGGSGTGDILSKAEAARDAGQPIMIVTHRPKPVAAEEEVAVIYDADEPEEATVGRPVNGRGWYARRMVELLGYSESGLRRTMREIHAEIPDEFDPETGERSFDLGHGG